MLITEPFGAAPPIEFTVVDAKPMQALVPMVEGALSKLEDDTVWLDWFIYGFPRKMVNGKMVNRL